MRGLRTVRVAVIDDDPRDALPLLRSLGKLKVGAAYFNGDVEGFPETPIRGLSIVFLDLQLTPSAKPESYLSQTIEALKRIVPDEHGGPGLVYWTKHPEDVEKLASYIKAEFSTYRPRFELRLDSKINLVENADKLALELMTTWESNKGTALLGEWGQVVHDSCTAVHAELFDLLDPEANIEDEVCQVAAALARSSGARVDLPPIAKMMAGLHSVQADALEREAEDWDGGGGHIEGLKNRPAVPLDLRARVNLMLLATVPSNPIRPSPGCLYLASAWDDNPIAFPFGRTPESLSAWVRDLASNLSEEMLADADPFLLEITPACDFAEGKHVDHRFIAGVLVPAEQAEAGAKVKPKLKSDMRAFAMDLGPLAHGIRGELKPVMAFVNMKCVYSYRGEDMAGRTPALVLRHQVVADVRGRFAAHAARTGHMSI